MKPIVIVCSILLLLNSCRFTTGSGHIVSEKRNVGSFSKIATSNAIDVEVKIGTAQDIEVEADDNIIKYLETRVSGDELSIDLEDLHNTRNTHLKVFITMPVLKSINASAASDVKVLDLLKYDGKLSFTASSSGNIEAQIDAPETYANASSAGTINLKGKTKNYDADASSAGNIKSADLLSENTNVSASSGGSAMVHASVSLKANASSGGNIGYYGGGAVNKTADSGGSVEKKD